VLAAAHVPDLFVDELAGLGGSCLPRLAVTLRALDTLLGDLGEPTKAQLEQAMKGHVLAEGRLVGTYEKER